MRPVKAALYQYEEEEAARRSERRKGRSVKLQETKED